MKIFIALILLIVSSQACNRQDKKTIPLSGNADSQQLIVMDSNPPIKPITTIAYHSVYKLDINTADFTGDTALQISQTLALLSSIDKYAAKVPHDTFSVFEKTTEGCAIIVIKDSTGKPIKLYGALFGEMGKMEFSYYLLPGNPKNLLATVVTDINYNGPITQDKIKIRSQKTTCEIYAGNKLIAILNGKKQRQHFSEKALQEAELNTREFFIDYIGQIEPDTKPDQN